MQMKKVNKYFHVPYEKEVSDSKKLALLIGDSGWIGDSMVIVNCNPDYSSRLVQSLNHGLSYLNGNELFPTVQLELPYPSMNQVWDGKEYRQFEKYLADWVRYNIEAGFSYLFVMSDVLYSKELVKVRAQVKGRTDFENFRFASVYVQDDCLFVPDYFVEKFNKESQGEILYQWENMDNKDWN